MPYLHGDIEDEAACYYEFACESVVILKAAEIYKTGKLAFEREGRRRGVIASFGGEEVFCAVEQELHCGPLTLDNGFMQTPWDFIWMCPSFPEKAWHQLSADERKEVNIGFDGKKVTPLGTPRLLTLHARGVLDYWTQKVADMRSEIREKGKSDAAKEITLAVDWPGESFADLVITLPLNQSAKEITKRFRETLRRPEIKELLHSSREKVGEIKDRLKDLAAWRLYRELGRLEALDFADANRLSDSRGGPRAFHDPRHGQGYEKRALSESPLFSDKAGFEDAKQRAAQWIVRNMPWEVVTSGETDSADANDDTLTAEWQKKLVFRDVIPEQHATVIFYRGRWRFLLGWQKADSG